MQQRSVEWHIERMGKITGTRFQSAMGGMGAKNTLIKTLMEERDLLAKGGEKLDLFIEQRMAVDAPALTWGRDYEDQALAAFELAYDLDVIKTGFTPHVQPEFSGFVGASLDGEIRDHDFAPLAIAEVKCPYNQDNHASTLMLGTPEKHIPQIQGNMWVSGFLRCFFISFDPRASIDNRLFVEQFEIDHAYCDQLAENCRQIDSCVKHGKMLDIPSGLNLF